MIGIRFHAYNPLAGGAFSKSFGASGAVAAGSRFAADHALGCGYSLHSTGNRTVLLER
jgi:aflatoxin B1 aldehyde reductase